MVILKASERYTTKMLKGISGLCWEDNYISSLKGFLELTNLLQFILEGLEVKKNNFFKEKT